ncbi:MAG: hypothetical protein ABII01_05785 [Candidatus Woesearchaeota archaeon]
MKIGKAIKRVAALGAGLSLVGATMFGAMAADLNQYPVPFIQDGVFNGILVVGTGGTDPAGLASDIIGVTDIIASLQFASTTGGTGTTQTVSGDAWKVGTSSKTLEVSENLDAGSNFENIKNVTTYVDGDNLDILKDGSLSNNKGTFDYTQALYFDNTATEYVMLKRDDDDNVGPMFYIANSDSIARYELEFTTDFESDTEDSTGTTTSTGTYLGDYEDEEISIAGRPYTIVKARRPSSSGSGLTLTLFGGSVKDTLEEGETKTYTIEGKDYEVTATAITDQGTIYAKFSVNGESTNSIADGGSDRLDDGMEIGVTDLIPNEAGDVTLDLVEFYLGAQKIELKDDDITDTSSSNSLKVNDDSISDANVILRGTNETATNQLYKLQKIIVEINASDNFYVEADESLSEQMDEPDALFPGSWDIEFLGLADVNTETIRISTSGSDQYNLNFADGAGNDVTVPLVATTSTNVMKLGDDSYDLIMNENLTIEKNDYIILEDSSQSAGNKNTWALKYLGASKSSSDSKTVKFKNLGTGETIERSHTASSDGNFSTVGSIDDSIATLSMGGSQYNVYAASNTTTSNFDIFMDLDASGALAPTKTVSITTDAGAQLTVENLTNSVVVNITTPDADDYENLPPTALSLNITASGGELGFSEGTVSTLNFISPPGDSNQNLAYTSMGGYIVWDNPTSDPDTLNLEYPKVQRTPLLYVTTESTSVSTTGGAGSENVNINRIEVGSSKLDSEVADAEAQNVISIGGACVNSITAALAGLPDYTCGAAGANPIGLQENKAILKLLEHDNGNVALIIAGWRAQDTRRAARVIANYEEHQADLSGMEVEVTGTTLNDISVGTPMVTTTTQAVTTTTEAPVE